MNTMFRVLVIALLVGLSPSLCLAQDAKDAAQAMRDLRFSFLSSSATALGFKPTKEYPRVFGVAMDWPVGDTTATIVSTQDGSASLYTTATFGIIGGAGHESVRVAAQRFVAAADSYHNQAVPTGTYPYPAKGKVRFYLRSFQDVRVIETDAASVQSSSGPYSPFFRAGQAVLTELRKVVEAKR
ncbi:MAG: hypothetical protein ACRELZ_02470 [Candidatus Rokuibacteriota bacterium]